MLVVFAVVFIISVMIYSHLSTKRVRELGMKVPGETPLPLIGNVLEILGCSDEEFFLKMIDFWKNFGLRARFFVGSQLVFILTDPKDVEVVLSKPEFIEKSDEYKYLHSWLGTGLLTSSGEKWRKRRKIITNAFHFKILENFVEIFDTQTDVLVNKLKKISSTEAFNITPLIALYTLDVICETAMGVSINAQMDPDSDYVKAVKDQCSVIHGRMMNPLKQPDILFRFSFDYYKQKRSLKILHGFTDKMIKERRNHLNTTRETMLSYTEDTIGIKKKMAFLDLLLLSTIDGKPLTDMDIREEVDTFLFEGHDTTSAALSFGLYLLSKNPLIQQKLYDEQMNLLGNDKGRPLLYSDLQNMKYMDLAIREILRLYPSVPILARKAASDTSINDLEIPKGCSIAAIVYSMNRNPDIFPDPEKFIPERYLPEEANKRHCFSSVSFSAGHRNCIGQKFAMLEMKANLSKIVRNFELLPSGRELRLSVDIILKSVNGIYIKIKPRVTE